MLRTEEKIYLVIFGTLGIFPTIVYLPAFITESLRTSLVISSIVYIASLVWLLSHKEKTKTIKQEKQETEMIKCDLCGGTETKPVLTVDGFNIVECKECSLKYINPRLTQEELFKLYNTESISPASYYTETHNEDMMTFEERITTIQEHRNGTVGGRLLDIGCSVGTLLKVAQQHNLDTTGLDVNKKCVNKQLGILEGEITTAKFDKKFDVITMIELIEHVKSPSETLKAAYDNLTDDGLLYLSTPDISSLMFQIFGKKWTPILPDEHIYYFDKKTLIKMLKKAGFKIELIRRAFRYRKMNTILDRLQRYNKTIAKILMKIIPKNIILKIKLYDELEVVARKNV